MWPGFFKNMVWVVFQLEWCAVLHFAVFCEKFLQFCGHLGRWANMRGGLDARFLWQVGITIVEDK